MDYKYDIKIPLERIAVLIGSKGSIKKELEEKSDSKISIDSEDGNVTIRSQDVIKLYSLKNVIYAIGRGFNPEFAEKLFKIDYTLEVIPLKNPGNSRKSILRIKGRLIGTEGKTRRYIESLTDTHISVFGKTISILGESKRVEIATRSINMLISGSNHSTVYAWLEETMKTFRLQEDYDISSENIKK